MATLSPLRFHYDSPEFALPIRLGLANSKGTQDLIVNILAPNNTRYEVANYPNVTIPTNLTGHRRGAHAVRRVLRGAVRSRARGATRARSSPNTRGTRARAIRARGRRSTATTSQTFGGDVIGTRYKDVARLHADPAARALRQGRQERPRVSLGRADRRWPRHPRRARARSRRRSRTKASTTSRAAT